jgi:hypothetical protein
VKKRTCNLIFQIPLLSRQKKKNQERKTKANSISEKCSLDMRRGGGAGGGGGGGGGRGYGNYTNPCLTMHQPWASLLVYGIKRIEGRSWTTPIRGNKKKKI